MDEGHGEFIKVGHDGAGVVGINSGMEISPVDEAGGQRLDGEGVPVVQEAHGPCSLVVDAPDSVASQKRPDIGLADDDPPDKEPPVGRF